MTRAGGGNSTHAFKKDLCRIHAHYQKSPVPEREVEVEKCVHMTLNVCYDVIPCSRKDGSTSVTVYSGTCWPSISGVNAMKTFHGNLVPQRKTYVIGVCGHGNGTSVR